MNRGSENNTGLRRLERLWTRGKDLLGVDYAIMGGAMSWLSDHQLVSAISNAGGFGVIACGSMTPDLLDIEIKKTFALTEKPFGVNLITMHPMLDDLIDVCLANKVSHIVLAGGLPPVGAIQRIKDGGPRVMCFAPALALAKRLIRSGVDALIIEGAEAGGHIGPVSTAILAQEILPVVSEVPIFVAGGIGRGEAMASYLQMGASGAQLGTRFVCANECRAHEKFKKAFIRASARDAIPSIQLDARFPVIPVRALKNKASELFLDFQKKTIERCHSGELDQKEAQLEIEKYWAGALKLAVIDGEVDTGSMMAGQSVGMVKSEQPIAEIISELVDQAAEFLEQASRPTG